MNFTKNRWEILCCELLCGLLKVDFLGRFIKPESPNKSAVLYAGNIMQNPRSSSCSALKDFLLRSLCQRGLGSLNETCKEAALGICLTFRL